MVLAVLMKDRFALHWLVVFSFVSIFFGTVLAIMIADKVHSASISSCVAHGFPRVLFTITVLVNAPSLCLIMHAFAEWYLHNIELRCRAYIYVQEIIGIVGVAALCGLAFFTTDEYHRVHIACASTFFVLMYVHLLMSTLLPYVSNVKVGFRKDDGWHVFRVCLVFISSLILLGTVTSMVHGNWIFSNFEWVYVTTFLAYLFSLWNELSTSVIESIHV